MPSVSFTDGSGSNGPMDMLQMAGTLMRLRQESKAQQDEASKRTALEQELGMPWAQIEAKMTAMHMTLTQQNINENTQQAAQQQALSDALKQVGINPSQLKAINMISEAQSAQYNAQAAAQKSAAVGPEQVAAATEVAGLHQTASALLRQIGGPALDLTQTVGGPNTAIGRLIGDAVGLPPAARVLHDAVNLTPGDLSSLPKGALAEHSARLSAAISDALKMTAEQRASSSASKTKAPAGYGFAQLESSVTAAKDKLDQLQGEYRTLIGKDNLPSIPAATLSQYESRIEAARNDWKDAMTKRDQAKESIAAGKGVPQELLQAPATTTPGATPDPAPAMKIDMQTLIQAKTAARKNLGPKAGPDEVDAEALRIYKSLNSK